MGFYRGPKIITDGLVMYLDAANSKSFKNKTNLINPNLWTLGSGGSVGFSPNGQSNENERIMGNNPWGKQAILWESRPNGSGNGDGGWNGDFFNTDNTKTYRFSVWVKRISDTGNGTFYLGTNSGGQCVIKLSDGNEECNPYWHCGNTGSLIKDQWYLVVGHCLPYTYSSSEGHPNSGFWTISGGKVGSINGCNIGNDCKFGPNTTSLRHRTYHYYCYDNTTRLQFYEPRVDLCDGNEPTMNELLSNIPNNINNLINKNPFNILNGVVYDKNNLGSIVFDGVNDYINLGIGTGYNILNNNFTISMWVMRHNGGVYGNLIGDYYTGGIQTNKEWQIMMGPNSEFNLYKHGSGYIIPNISSGSSNNKWIHLVISRVGTIVSLYANNKVITTATDGTSYGTNTGNLNIGIDGDNLSEPFNGKISNIKLYNNYGFTSEDVKQDYNATKSRYNL